jgi:hypothetical protein
LAERKAASSPGIADGSISKPMSLAVSRPGRRLPSAASATGRVPSSAAAAIRTGAPAAASRFTTKVSHSAPSSSPASGLSATAWQERPLSQPTVQSLNSLSSAGTGAGAASAAARRAGRIMATG